MSSLTLCMIVKNEELFLNDCLESVNSIVDEIVLVDTGSEDNTLQIAQMFNSKIFHFDWIDDFSAARNYSLQQATGNWILYLDADERLEPNSVNIIRDIISRNKKLGVRCNVKSRNETGGTPSQMQYVRLFRNNPNIKFSGKVHEQIEPSLLHQGYEFIDSNVNIIHLGYDVDKQKLKEKADRNLKLLLEDYKTNPSGYNAFQIGQSYLFLDEKEKAVNYFRIAVDKNDLVDSHLAHCYRYIAAFELEKKNYDITERYLKKGLRLAPNSPLLNILGANLSIELHREKEAEEYCLKAYNSNQDILIGKTNTHFDVTLNEENMIFYGINLAIIISNSSLFDFFYTKLNRSESPQEDLKIADLYNDIFNHKKITEFDLPAHKILPNILLKNLINYPLVEPKLKLMETLDKQFISNFDYQLYFGNFLLSIGKRKDALKKFENVLQLNPRNAELLLNMIALYSEENDFESILKLVVKGKNVFTDLPTLKSQLEQIENKISAFLK